MGVNVKEWKKSNKNITIIELSVSFVSGGLKGDLTCSIVKRSRDRSCY